MYRLGGKYLLLTGQYFEFKKYLQAAVLVLIIHSHNFNLVLVSLIEESV